MKIKNEFFFFLINKMKIFLQYLIAKPIHALLPFEEIWILWKSTTTLKVWAKN